MDGFLYSVATISVSPECGNHAFEPFKLATNNGYHVILENFGDFR